MKKEKNLKYFLYGIYNTVNGKLYIGITADCNKRWQKHIRMAKSKTKYAIHWAISKYGSDNFIFKQIEEYDNWIDACNKEIQWIKCLKENTYQLYNETDGGDGTLGVRRYGADNPNFGKEMKPHVKETLIKIRRKLSDDQIQEIISLYTSGNYSQTQLSKQYDVSLTQIHRIVNGKSWGDKKHDEILTKKNMTVDDAYHIKRLYATGEYTQKELAKQFNCSPGHIGKIIRGEKWKN